MPADLPYVRQRLEEDIVFGRRRPRERLVEDEIVEQLHAKKHVVREALAELERMGLVQRKRNKGAMVRDYSPEEVRQIFSVRELLEGEAAKQIPLPAERELTSDLKAIQADHDKAAEAGDLANAFRINIRFHRTLFQACGNPYLLEAINDFALKTHGIRSYSLANPNLLRQARADHWAIIAALETGERDRLVELCIGHLKPPVRAYIDVYDTVFGDGQRLSA